MKDTKWITDLKKIISDGKTKEAIESFMNKIECDKEFETVSYTHLTLPTILRV